MKIRIRGNSVRLRLTQSEIDSFNQNGFFEQSCHFGAQTDNSFVYRLEKKVNLQQAEAQMTNGAITVYLPYEKATSWAESDQVGIEHVKKISDSDELRILVEKDFQCLKPRMEEDESDNFPNPQALS